MLEVADGAAALNNFVQAAGGPNDRIRVTAPPRGLYFVRGRLPGPAAAARCPVTRARRRLAARVSYPHP